MKVYLVWNAAKNECVGFTDLQDAEYAMTGESPEIAVSTLADAFRDVYDDDADDELLSIQEIKV